METSFRIQIASRIRAAVHCHNVFPCMIFIKSLASECFSGIHIFPATVWLIECKRAKSDVQSGFFGSWCLCCFRCRIHLMLCAYPSGISSIVCHTAVLAKWVCRLSVRRLSNLRCCAVCTTGKVARPCTKLYIRWLQSIPRRGCICKREWQSHDFM